MTSTILGASGFIGRHLAAGLRDRGIQCWLPKRGDERIYQRPLGCVYYCIGLTADFRERPYDTIDAHIGALRNLLERADFNQLVYLSSTRVYAGSQLADESQRLNVSPVNPDDLYNLSKLTGECLALSSGRTCRVARLSNVLGPDMGSANFVGALVAEARSTGRLLLRSALSSEKDYVWIDDAVAGLIALATAGRQPIYNLAGGVNLPHSAIVGPLAERGIQIQVAENAPVTSFPTISIERLVSDTGFRPAPVMEKLVSWLDSKFGHDS
jgi:nucleoside-diphosphate-sugar epimerase